MGALGLVDWTWGPGGPPPASDHPNHKSALEHRVLLGEQLNACLAMGMVEACMEGMSSGEFAVNILPLGARIKPSGACRMLVDPSLPGVNAAMAELPCDLPSAESIFSEVRGGEVLGKRDLQNGFFHVVLCPEARRHMAFRHPVTGSLMRWVVLPQGTKQSPAIFCAVSNASSRIFNRAFAAAGIQAWVRVFVDDYVLRARTHADLVRAFDCMDAEAALLGLVFNPDKDVGRDAPCTCLEALGLVMDSAALTLSLPESKRASYLAAIASFRSSHASATTSRRKPLEQLVGKLVFACRVCTWGFLFIQAILDSLYPVGQFPAPPHITLDEGVWADLAFWEDALGDGYATWLGIKQHVLGRKEVLVDPAACTVELFTDASGGWGCGGVLGFETLSQAWARDTSGEHIGALELEALYVALAHWRDQLRGHTILARLDNIQAVVAVNKGASRKPALRSTLRKIALLGLEAGFLVKAKHVRGIHNPADAPSRGRKRLMAADLVFTEFASFNSPPATIDCFTDEARCFVQPGCSLSFTPSDPATAHVDMLVGKVSWAAMPFAEVGSYLDAFAAAWRQDTLHTVVTCVVPDWPTASWYRRYLRRRKPLFRVLRRFEAGSKVFRLRSSLHATPHPCPVPLLVIRIGGTQA